MLHPSSRRQLGAATLKPFFKEQPSILELPGCPIYNQLKQPPHGESVHVSSLGLDSRSQGRNQTCCGSFEGQRSKHPLTRKARIRTWEGADERRPTEPTRRHLHPAGRAPGGCGRENHDPGLAGLSSDARPPPRAHVHRQRLEACVSAPPTRAGGSRRQRGAGRQARTEEPGAPHTGPGSVRTRRAELRGFGTACF